jgi:hypothetical protein
MNVMQRVSIWPMVVLLVVVLLVPASLWAHEEVDPEAAKYGW